MNVFFNYAAGTTRNSTQPNPMIPGKKDAKEKFWASVVQQQKKSGQRISVFCQDYNISKSNFYRWKRLFKMRQTGNESTATAAKPAVQKQESTISILKERVNRVLRENPEFVIEVSFFLDKKLNSKEIV